MEPSPCPPAHFPPTLFQAQSLPSSAFFPSIPDLSAPSQVSGVSHLSRPFPSLKL